MRRILFFVPCPLVRTLGAAKHVLELSDVLGSLGWEAEAVGPDEITPGGMAAWAAAAPEQRCEWVADHVRQHADRFDVIDYDHGYLPFPRESFSPRVVLAARSFLLHHHLLRIRIPRRPGLRGLVGRLLNGRRRRRELAESVGAATRTCRAADLVCVCNSADVAELATHGVPPDKVCVSPIALTPARRAELGRTDPAPPPRPCVAFVGSFDPRKGMTDFPRIVAGVARAVPGVRFKLLGTAGLVRTAEEVYAAFPSDLRPALDVIPRFDPADLPELLADCSAGVFPSYLEGFPFGVLEMLAAALPVVAYRAPGPPDMLPDQYLVQPGDAEGMAARVAALLTDPDRLRAARLWARARSADFTWEDVARRTAAAYEAALARRRDPKAVGP